MIKRLIVTLAAILPVTLLVAGAAAPGNAATTTLSMTFMKPDGLTPMAGTAVSVYYRPFNPPHRKYSLPLMGSGTTNAAGLRWQR